MSSDQKDMFVLTKGTLYSASIIILSVTVPLSKIERGTGIITPTSPLFFPLSDKNRI